jgi:hypothetical protein
VKYFVVGFLLVVVGFYSIKNQGVFDTHDFLWKLANFDVDFLNSKLFKC